MESPGTYATKFIGKHSFFSFRDPDKGATIHNVPTSFSAQELVEKTGFSI